MTRGYKGNETPARIRIDNTLVALGWRLDDGKDGPADVRVEGDVKSPRDKARLKGGRPDYILYDGDDIVGLIEAKKPGGGIAAGLEQCARYARMLKRKNIACFCADGNITQARHASGAALKINGESVDELPPPHHAAALAKEPNLNLGGEIRSIGQLVGLFNQSADVLRNDGVEAGLDSLREFCLLLFVKVMTERGANLPGCGWDELAGKSGENLMAAYRRIVADYQSKYRDIFRDAAVKNPALLKKLIDGIDGVNFSRSDLDVKGGAYEHFLAKFNVRQGSVLGQYFTPRHITRMLAKLMNFRLGETIYDPFCGTGGMLIACYMSLRNQARTAVDKKWLNEKALFGGDIAPTAAQLAKMNMVLLGDGHANIVRADSIAEYAENKYDAVITNIPFGLPPRGRETAELYRGASGGNADEISVLHCMHAVKPGGRAAMIAPENLAYLERHAAFRAFVAGNASIRAVVRLPRHTFKPYTSARTFVLLLENIWKGETKRFPFADVRHDGFSESAWREPIDDNDIPELLADADMGWRDGAFISAKAGSWFPARADARTAADSWSLGELLDLAEERTDLRPDAPYKQPKLNSTDNTVKINGAPRLGRNIRARAKIIAAPGDLIIATLHTQRGNGLFAFSDDYYVCTSQIVGKVRENIVDKNYLRLMLRKALPKLVVRGDLVGRETFKPADILAVRIPKITGARRQMMERYIALGKQRDDAEREMREIESAI